MSDLLAVTGWIGEHPRTGQDVAHLFLYALTSFDADSGAKLTRLAQQWGWGPATAEPPRGPGARVFVQSRKLEVPGTEMPVPTTPAWITAARVQGFAILTLTTRPLAAPDLDVIDAHIAAAPAGSLWHCRAKVVNE